jgi:hypothetical protein
MGVIIDKMSLKHKINYWDFSFKVRKAPHQRAKLAECVGYNKYVSSLLKDVIDINLPDFITKELNLN